MTTALEGGECSTPLPGRNLPPGKDRYPVYRRLGGTQGRFGLVRKISPPPGFDPRTDVFVVLYTNGKVFFTKICERQSEASESVT
jgi:hypothetical protein